MKIEEEVLARIIPKEDENEQIFNVVKDVTKNILKEAKLLKIAIEVELVGSCAKGTHLTGPDIDLFIVSLFSP